MVAAAKKAVQRTGKDVFVNLAMPANLVRRIDEVARLNGRDRSKEIRFVMTQHVQQHVPAVAP